MSKYGSRRLHHPVEPNLSGFLVAHVEVAIIEPMALESLRQYRGAMLSLAARHGVRNVRVFGSMARGDARPNSDLDLLVDVELGRTLLDVEELPKLEQASVVRSARLRAAASDLSEEGNASI